MGRKTIDRTGEKGVNNFGSEMVIVEYRKAIDIDIYFPEYNWTFKHGRYNAFKKGNIKCPYEPRYFDIGYLGEGKYTVSENGKNKKEYKIPGETMCLDKDILCKGNKVYSRDTCIFVPERINNLFVKSDKARGKCPIGVTLTPSGTYQVYCSNKYGKSVYLGTYNSEEEAFQVYKQYKEKVIKEIIDSYEGKIPEPHYSRLREAMYNYEVEIDD